MRLKELRTEKGATQKEVAEFICCSPLVYSRYEREEREPDIDSLCRLADYFGVTIDYLVGREKIIKQ
ncbi:MAG: helix-turn-helix transcriptional regulator [Clostridia bacterium]|nr:helix-turn-helix transcriptional regulator [Clostridia bacterium]